MNERVSAHTYIHVPALPPLPPTPSNFMSSLTHTIYSYYAAGRGNEVRSHGHKIKNRITPQPPADLTPFYVSHAHARDDAEHPTPRVLGELGALLCQPLLKGNDESLANALVHLVLHSVGDVLRRKIAGISH